MIEYYIQNYTIISLSQINTPTPKPKLILTFDDGYKDFMLNVLPVLKKNNLPFVVSVVVDTLINGNVFWTQKLSQIINHCLITESNLEFRINSENKFYTITKSNAEQVSLTLFHVFKILSVEDRTKILDEKIVQYKTNASIEMMNVEDIKLCLKSNAIIANHSYTHDFLSEYMNSQVFRKEVIQSKHELEKITEHSIDVFCSPNGELNDVLINTAKEANYKFLFTTNTNVFIPKPSNEIQIVPRILLYGTTTNELIFRTTLFHKKLINFYPNE